MKLLISVCALLFGVFAEMAQANDIDVLARNADVATTQARASLRIVKAPYCPGIVCRLDAHVALRDNSVKFVYAGVCMVPDSPHVHPCYNSTGRRALAIMTSIQLSTLQYVRVTVKKQGTMAILTWRAAADNAFIAEKILIGGANWDDKDTRSFTRVIITSSSSANPRIHVLLKGIVPAGGSLYAEPPYTATALSAVAWKAYY